MFGVDTEVAALPVTMPGQNMVRLINRSARTRRVKPKLKPKQAEQQNCGQPKKRRPGAILVRRVCGCMFNAHGLVTRSIPRRGFLSVRYRRHRFAKAQPAGQEPR